MLPWEGRNQAEWDFAKAGVGALDVAYQRALEAEVDRYTGLTYGAILWDFIKVFDTLDPAHLVQEAVALGFPAADFCLGLRMHLAPRRLMILNVLSQVTQPLRSVLPRCIYAVTFAKVYMRRAMGTLVDTHALGCSTRLI